MTELNQTGFMHNRMRMVVSQFLTKDLFIDWTWGEDYFRRKLIDFDSASNVHGWQWSASTGTDAVLTLECLIQVVRVNDLIKMLLYIKTFIPQLNDVTPKLLHEPLNMKRS